MPIPLTRTALRIRQVTLLLGVLQLLVGCLVGLLPPDAVAWFRGVVMAHVEFTGNGVLLIALGLLVPELRFGRRTWWVWFATVQAGTWLNGTAALVAGLRGRSSPFLALASRTSPPPNGTADTLVSGLLLATACCMLLGLVLTIVGLVRGWRTACAAPATESP